MHRDAALRRTHLPRQRAARASTGRGSPHHRGPPPSPHAAARAGTTTGPRRRAALRPAGESRAGRRCKPAPRSRRTDPTGRRYRRERNERRTLARVQRYAARTRRSYWSYVARRRCRTASAATMNSAATTGRVRDIPVPASDGPPADEPGLPDVVDDVAGVCVADSASTATCAVPPSTLTTFPTIVAAPGT